MTGLPPFDTPTTPAPLSYPARRAAPRQHACSGAAARTVAAGARRPLPRVFRARTDLCACVVDLHVCFGVVEWADLFHELHIRRQPTYSGSVTATASSLHLEFTHTNPHLPAGEQFSLRAAVCMAAKPPGGANCSQSTRKPRCCDRAYLLVVELKNRPVREDGGYQFVKVVVGPQVSP